MNHSLWQRLRWKTLAALGLCTGCAVMVVDVDVYKGPLANHREVQVQQMAAMAVGARPVLMRLRNELESNSELPDEHVPSEMLEVPDARRVNDVIELYDDLEFAPEAEAFVQALRAIRDQWKIWLHCGDEAARWLAAKSGTAARKSALQQLADDYAVLLRPPTAVWRSVGKLRPRLIDDPLERDDYYSATDFFQRLADPKGRVPQHAAKLFPNNPTQQAAFAKQTHMVGHAFLGLRENIGTVFRSTLKIVRTLGDRASPDSAVTRKLATIVCDTIDARYLGAVVLAATRHCDDLPDSIGPHAKALARIAGKRIDELVALSTKLKKHEHEKAGNYQRRGFRYQETSLRKLLLPELQRLLVNRPAATAQSLLAADGWVRNPQSWQNESDLRHWGLDPSFRRPLKRRYGIARGPHSDDGGVAAAKGYIKAIREAQELLQDLNVLSRGRLPRGLLSLIDAFLRESHQSDYADATELQSYADLSNALTRFAEKLLFIANSETLFAAPSEGLRWVVQQVGRRLNPFGGRTSSSASVRVLQSIGWSILVQADELRHWQDHRRRGKRSRRAEVSALRRARHLVPKAAMKGLTDTAADQVRRAKHRTSKLRLELLALETEIKNTTTKATGLGAAPAPHQTAPDKLWKAWLEEADALRSELVRPNPANHSVAEVGFVFEFRLRISLGIEWLFGTPARMTKIEQVVRALDRFQGALRQRVIPGPSQEHREALLAAIEASTKLAKTQRERALLAARLTTAVADHTTAKQAKTLLDKISDSVIAAFSAGNDAVSRTLRSSLSDELDSIDALLAAARKKSPPDAAAIKSLQDRRKLMVATQESVDRILSSTGIAAWASPTSDDFRQIAKLLLDRDAATHNPKSPKAVELARRWIDGFRGMGPLDEELLDAAADAKGVLDVLIADLRQRLLAATERYGEESPAALRIAVALRAAYEHRTGMVYIRPPSAYLRTSYPSSSLQSDPGLSWSNMLAEQAWRSVPGYALLNPLLGTNTDRFAEVTAEIDKRFWQNINRVRVAGAGNTNYVVAKDDIGNWYVKAYAADSAPISKAAFALGRYSLGPALGGDPFADTPRPDGPDGNSDQAAKRNQPSIDRARANFAAAFAKKADARAESVQGLLGTEGAAAQARTEIEAKLEVAEANRDAILQQLQPALAFDVAAAAKKHLDRSASGEDPADQAGDRALALAAALRLLRDHANRVETAIAGVKEIQNADELRTIVDRTLRRPVEDELVKLATILEAYQTQLGVLSDSVRTPIKKPATKKPAKSEPTTDSKKELP